MGRSGTGDSPDVEDLQRRLLRWHDSNWREFLWRRTANPYAVLVAEKLLQQTVARLVVAAFEDFMRRYPTVYDLADAPHNLEQVDAPLGFQYLVAEMRALAVTLMERHAGKSPPTFGSSMTCQGSATTRHASA